MNRKRYILILAFAAAVILSGGGHASADFTFGTPTNLGPTVNSTHDEWSLCISPDGLELFFDSYRPLGSGGWDIWVTTRATTNEPWGDPVNLGPTVNSPAKESFPCISSDGLSLFLESTRPGGYGDHDLWVTMRPTVSDIWGPPVNLGLTVNGSYVDATPSISADGLSLFFESNRPGGYGEWDLWVTTRASISDPWEPPVNLGLIVNSPSFELTPIISADGLLLFFCSDRPAGFGDYDLWVTRRKTIDADWDTPVNLGPIVNSSFGEGVSSISADGSTLYFLSNRPGGFGGYDLYQVSIEPVVDLNGDGIVDSADICIMVDHWQTDEPLCDIGPMPWGDGIVDVQDLIVLAEHLFEEIPPVE